MKILRTIVAKLTSARYMMSIAVAFTLCFLANRSFSLLTEAAGAKDPTIFAHAKEISMFVLGAFITSAQSIITSYFHKADKDQLPETIKDKDDDDNNPSTPRKNRNTITTATAAEEVKS